MALSLALNAMEISKATRQHSEGERTSLMERHAAEVAEGRKLLADMAEKIISDARTINHFYHK